MPSPPSDPVGPAPPHSRHAADPASNSFTHPNPRHINPFTTIPTWQTLGFEHPATTSKHDTSFVPAGGGDMVSTPPAETSWLFVAAVHTAWEGHGVVRGCCLSLEDGLSVIDSTDGGRGRETYVLGLEGGMGRRWS